MGKALASKAMFTYYALPYSHTQKALQGFVDMSLQIEHSSAKSSRKDRIITDFEIIGPHPIMSGLLMLNETAMRGY